MKPVLNEQAAHALNQAQMALRLWLTRDGKHTRGCRALTYPDRACSRTCVHTLAALAAIKAAR